MINRSTKREAKRWAKRWDKRIPERTAYDRPYKQADMCRTNFGQTFQQDNSQHFTRDKRFQASFKTDSGQNQSGFRADSGTNMALVQRETDVLATIIEAYITTAAPVGSRAVSRHSDLKLSPASMRNTMADLTDQGYLEQPHTSAGRIPTAKALRHYVDNILRIRPLTGKAARSLLDRLTGHGLEIPQMLRQASSIVSDMSRQVGVVLAPDGNDVRWRNMDFSLLADRMVLVVLVLDGGIVKNRVVQLDSAVSADELARFANYLNTHFTGRTLSEVRSLLLADLHYAENRLEQAYAQALLLARQAFEELDTERELFVEGTLQVLQHAEFADPARMRELLTLLEERTRLLKLLDRTLTSNDITVTFGTESETEGLEGYTLITAPYGGDTPLGVVSVIGPVRMDYGKVLPIVRGISQSLSTLLKDRFSHGC